MTVALPVALSWCGIWEVKAIVVERLDTGEGESEQSTGGEKEEGEVVAFLEAKRPIDFAEPSAEGVRGFRKWSGRCHLVVQAQCRAGSGKSLSYFKSHAVNTRSKKSILCSLRELFRFLSYQALRYT